MKEKKRQRDREKEDNTYKSLYRSFDLCWKMKATPMLRDKLFLRMKMVDFEVYSSSFLSVPLLLHLTRVFVVSVWC